MNKSIIAVIGTLMLVVQISAQRINITQVPSFPGAEGHGRYTPGGRGGKVIHVTNFLTSSMRHPVSFEVKGG